MLLSSCCSKAKQSGPQITLLTLKAWGVTSRRRRRRAAGRENQRSAMAVRIMRGMEDLVASGSQLVWSLAHQTLRRWYNHRLMPCRRFLETWFRMGKCYQVWQLGGQHCRKYVKNEEVPVWLILPAAWAALVINYCIGFLRWNFPLSEVSQCFFLIWLISACVCLFVWTWGGTGCLVVSHKVCSFNKGPSPRTCGNHLKSSVFELGVCVTRRASKVVFEMQFCVKHLNAVLSGCRSSLTCHLCRLESPGLCSLQEYSKFPSSRKHTENLKLASLKRSSEIAQESHPFHFKAVIFSLVI